jgi:hypothetical protein
MVPPVSCVHFFGVFYYERCATKVHHRFPLSEHREQLIVSFSEQWEKILHTTGSATANFTMSKLLLQIVIILATNANRPLFLLTSITSISLTGKPAW